MNEKQISEKPSEDKDLTAVKMLIENIGYQYASDEMQGIYNIKDITKHITNKEQLNIFARFKHIQFELVNLINRANRLYNSLSDITVTMFVFFNNKKIKAVINEEKPSLEWVINSILEDTKELVVMANVLKGLGRLWGVKGIEDLGEQLDTKALDNLSDISLIEELDINFEVPLLDYIEQERISEELKRIGIDAPILIGYYNGFSEYEDEVRLWHGEER